MRIGVISDTHLPGCTRKLKRIVDHYFSETGLILHAGDLVDLAVLDAFGSREVRAVCGNMDPLSVRNLLQDRLILEINGFRLGMMHGWGKAECVEDNIYKLLGPLDCLIYGHTHYPANRIRNGVLFFNPGSAMDKRYAPENTVGILEIGDQIKGKILKIEIEKET